MKYLKVIYLLLSFFLVYVFLLDLSLAQIKKYALKQNRAEEIRYLGIILAVSKEGVSEYPPKSNNGKEINEFLESVNLKSGNSWCVAFCQWAFLNSAKTFREKLNLIKSGHALTIYDYARRNGFASRESIKAGDWIIFQRGNTISKLETIKGHCGIVISFDGKVITTIEGNVSNPDNSNHGVYKKTRRFNQFGWLRVVGFIGFE